MPEQRRRVPVVIVAEDMRYQLFIQTAFAEINASSAVPAGGFLDPEWVLVPEGLDPTRMEGVLDQIAAVDSVMLLNFLPGELSVDALQGFESLGMCGISAFSGRAEYFETAQSLRRMLSMAPQGSTVMDATFSMIDEAVGNADPINACSDMLVVLAPRAGDNGETEQAYQTLAQSYGVNLTAIEYWGSESDNAKLEAYASAPPACTLIEFDLHGPVFRSIVDSWPSLEGLQFFFGSLTNNEAFQPPLFTKEEALATINGNYAVVYTPGRKSFSVGIRIREKLREELPNNRDLYLREEYSYDAAVLIAYGLLQAGVEDPDEICNGVVEISSAHGQTLQQATLPHVVYEYARRPGAGRPVDYSGYTGALDYQREAYRPNSYFELGYIADITIGTGEFERLVRY